MGDATLAGAQTFTGNKTFSNSDPSLTSLTIQAAATGQLADTVQAFSGTDTGEGGQRQRTFYLNEKGELRCISAKGNSVGVRFKGQPTQSVDIMQITDTGNNPISRFDKAGMLKSPVVLQPFCWSVSGNVSAAQGPHSIRNMSGVDLDFRAICAQVGTAPTGADITISVKLNGTRITAADLVIPAGQTSSALGTAFTTATWPAGGLVTIQITGVGSGTPGADLVVQVAGA